VQFQHTRWHAQNLSLMRGACVPLPVAASAKFPPPVYKSPKRTSAGRPDQNHPDALLRLVPNASLALQPALELRNALLEPGDSSLEVRDRRICERGHCVDV